MRRKGGALRCVRPDPQRYVSGISAAEAARAIAGRVLTNKFTMPDARRSAGFCFSRTGTAFLGNLGLEKDNEKDRE